VCGCGGQGLDFFGGGHFGASPTNGRKGRGASKDVLGWPPPLSPCRGRALRITPCKGLVFSALGKNSELRLGEAETLTRCDTLERASAREGHGGAVLTRARRDATASGRIGGQLLGGGAPRPLERKGDA
jgi:hypothetical protein